MEFREFRGKRPDNNEWAFGCLLVKEPPLKCVSTEEKEKSKYLIGVNGFADWNLPRPFYTVEVKPETIGQYIGLEDKNNERLFELDIVKGVYSPLGSNPKAVQYYKEGVIVWDYNGYGIQYKVDGVKILDKDNAPSYIKDERKIYIHPTAGEDWIDKHVHFSHWEKIGNIFDNAITI